MNKTVQVINTMIGNSDKITDIQIAGDEIYFQYNLKYAWSILEKDHENTILYLYPNYGKNTEQLINDLRGDPQFMPQFVAYRNIDFKSQEADESFRELLQIVKDKLFGVDKIFNDILDEPF